MNYDEIVQDVIEKHKDSPIDILGIGDSKFQSASSTERNE